MSKYTPSLNEIAKQATELSNSFKHNEFSLSDKVKYIATMRRDIVSELNDKFKELKKLAESLGYAIEVKYTEDGIDVNKLKLKVNDTIMVSYI